MAVRGQHLRCSLGKIQLQHQLADLALEGGNAGLILKYDAGLGLLVCPFAAVELGQPKLDEVGRDVMAAVCITPTNDATTDVLAELPLERCRMSAVGTS